MRDEPKIEFYRTDAVHNVLKHYDFSDEEKHMITAAIIAAKREKPNMKLIEKADVLLEEITSNRTPIKQEIDKVDLAKAQARVAMVDANSKRIKAEMGSKGLGLTLLATVLLGTIVVAVYKYKMEDKSPLPSLASSSRYITQEPTMLSFTEAETYCKERKKVLPMTFEDAPKHLEVPDQYNQQGYWRANGGVIYNIVQFYDDKLQPDDKKYYVVCVQTNNKHSAQVR